MSLDISLLGMVRVIFNRGIRRRISSLIFVFYFHTLLQGSLAVQSILFVLQHMRPGQFMAAARFNSLPVILRKAMRCPAVIVPLLLLPAFPVAPQRKKEWKRKRKKRGEKEKEVYILMGDLPPPPNHPPPLGPLHLPSTSQHCQRTNCVRSPLRPIFYLSMRFLLILLKFLRSAAQLQNKHQLHAVPACRSRGWRHCLLKLMLQALLP